MKLLFSLLFVASLIFLSAYSGSSVPVIEEEKDLIQAAPVFMGESYFITTELGGQRSILAARNTLNIYINYPQNNYNAEKIITDLPAPEPISAQTSPTAIIPTPIQDSEVVSDSPIIDPNRPMVALTFDDGPSRHTDHILDLLEKQGGRATFFVLGNLVDSRRDTVVRAVSLGNEVVGYSWDHKDLSRLSAQEIRAQLRDTDARIAAVTGKSTNMFRPPYGALNSTVTNVAAEMGYCIIYWSIDTLDWKYRDPSRIYNVIMNEVTDGSIILLHDIHGTTAQAMNRVIPQLVSEGYQLVTVSELLYHRHGGIEPGRVYYSGNR